jgi:transposase
MDATRSDDHGSSSTAALMRELESLRAQRDTLIAERSQAESKIAELAAELDKVSLDRDFIRTELEKVRHQLAKFLRDRYGKKAESVDLELFAHLLVTEAAKSETVTEKEEKELRTWIEGHHRTRRARGARYENLPEKVREIELTEEQKKCSCCGEQRVRIGEERHTRLEYKPAEVWRETTVQGKYACPFCPQKGVETAPVEAPAMPRCLAGTSLMSAVVVNKYCHHLPLYRQEEVFAAAGLHLSRSLMCDTARLSADAVLPLWNLLRKEVRSMAPAVEWRVVQTDDTPTKVLRPGSGKTKEARMWIYLGHGSDPEHERKYAVFEYTESRAGRWSREWFDDYVGNVQADAYAAYDALFRTGRVMEFGCMAHARRKFVDAMDVDRETCLRVLAMIRELYQVEHAAEQKALLVATERGTALPRTERCAIRRAIRQEQAVPVLERLKLRLDDLASTRRVLPKSPVGQAVEYTRNNWTALSRYVENGAVELDNNAAERMLRPIAVGRRNWTFLGSDHGGETAAILFSVLGSARLHEIEPWAYMRALLERVPRVKSDEELRELLPDRWIAANPGHRLPLARSNKGW